MLCLLTFPDKWNVYSSLKHAADRNVSSSSVLAIISAQNVLRTAVSFSVMACTNCKWKGQMQGVFTEFDKWFSMVHAPHSYTDVSTSMSFVGVTVKYDQLFPQTNLSARTLSFTDTTSLLKLVISLMECRWRHLLIPSSKCLLNTDIWTSAIRPQEAKSTLLSSRHLLLYCTIEEEQ